ncbi:hypothetical protein [Bradyrhizobium commune]|uniref:Alpha/beta hydrolase n=1 Tax=Bradyrhizobium commune TaxID=83627 RepID=A0A7S9CZT4_9BRAD|nr:hypothetical protein [Bradyrhizobium commune]QPF88569.1 hypothetical protein IC761_18675 [Bradyrhizobium commune]
MSEPTAKKPDVVVLVHGIRTRAHWQRTVPGWLAIKGKLDVVPVSYGYVGVVGFLNPVLGRRRKAENVLKQLNEIRAEYPANECHMSIIAHSFGTYLVTRILQENSYLIIGDLLLCGSVAPDSQDWTKIRNQTQNRARERGKGLLVNDCGSLDIWPVMARVATWGFDSTGTYGIRKNGVIDRFHPIRHSEFFQKDFVDKYWKPFVDRSDVVLVEDSDKIESPKWFGLFELPIKLILVAVLIALVASTGLARKSLTDLVAHFSPQASSSDQARAEINRQNEEKFVDAILQAVLGTGSAASTRLDNQAKATRWLEQHGLSVSLGQFLTDPNYAAQRVQMMRDLTAKPQDNGPSLLPSALPPEKLRMAKLIAAKFGDAGFGRNQQIAAVANAIAESNLDPNMRLNTPAENAVGLFLLNSRGGLGTGFTIEQLADPETNIGIVVQQAKKVPEFTAANSLEDAVTAFVRFIEKPANIQSEIARRTKIAKTVEQLI